MKSIVNISELVGQFFSNVCIVETDDGDKLIFEKSNGDTYSFYPNRECCESITLKEIVGNLSNLENSPILIVEENWYDTDVYSWSFYKFKFVTQKGHVDISWYPESNGCYPTGVTMYNMYREF